jgi:tetratricopeptide (TPR) repeat protein
MTNSLCFVLMPFNKKQDSSGVMIDFDAVYDQLIAPAIEEAGLVPVRADKEMAGGIIHKPMFERLIICDFAVADLTSANANVFYELGIRHAIKPYSTVLVFYSDGSRLPFDVSLLRGLPYKLNSSGVPSDIEGDKAALVKRLLDARQAITELPSVDSPIFQLVEGFPNVDQLKADVFHDLVRSSNDLKKRLDAARKEGIKAVRALEAGLDDIKDLEAGIAIDLLLSYRAVEGWEEMVNLVGKMPRPLASTALVQEQLAFALNRLKRRKEAEKILVDLIESQGPSKEANGFLGRVYKDMWEDALESGNDFMAAGYLKKAIEAYIRGFETDWRDAYPGVDAVTLMEIKEPPDERFEKVLPVVSYAVEQRIARGQPDYWDHATRLELAVLAKDQEAAYEALSDALASISEPWEPETTARNLRIIREARERRSDDVPWAAKIEEVLRKMAADACAP